MPTVTVTTVTITTVATATLAATLAAALAAAQAAVVVAVLAAALASAALAAAALASAQASSALAAAALATTALAAAALDPLVSVAGAVLIFFHQVHRDLSDTQGVPRSCAVSGTGCCCCHVSEPGCYLLSYAGCWVRSRCSTSRGWKLWPRCPMPLCTSINVES